MWHGQDAFGFDGTVAGDDGHVARLGKHGFQGLHLPMRNLADTRTKALRITCLVWMSMVGTERG